MNEDTALVEAWIEQTQGLVRSLAYNIHRGLPEHVPVEDIIGYGQIGLMQAAKAYRADYQTSFQTFAYYRIRGAMLDGLGKMAWTKGATRKKMVSDRAADELLETDGSENFHDDQGRAAAAGWLVRTTEKLAVVQLLSAEDGSRGSGEEAVEDQAERPDEQVARDELWDKLAELVKNLPEVERALIELTYYEGKSLAEAARALGHSKSWASRLHTQILQRLARSVNLLDVG